MLIPDSIQNFKSNGEKYLYLRFKNDAKTNDFYILHSVFTNYHLKKVSGELDFLLLVPGHGIFAIEVKHGRVFRRDGVWCYQNKEGKVTEKRSGPFSQVSDTMHSIRKYILEKLPPNSPEHNRMRKILFGTGVAFTSMQDPIDFGPEGLPWQVLTQRGLRGPISQYIFSLSKHWHKHHTSERWYDADLSRPTDKDCYKILQLLRGDFEIKYTRINKMVSQENLIEEFTREQFEILDFVNFNDRCLIRGGAGTGKTVMALEIFNRQHNHEGKIGLFCYNRKLGKKLKNHTDQLVGDEEDSKHFIGTFHKYLINNTSLTVSQDSDEKFYNEDLPFSFLLENEELKEEDKFDLLIIDEAQDLITDFYLEVFDKILKGGLKKGKCVFLGDFSNQAIYLNDPEQSLNLLREKVSIMNFPPLSINCRNTVKISIQNCLLTGTDKPAKTHKKPEGDPVITAFKNKSKIIQEIKKEINGLIAKGIPLNRITILSPKTHDNSIIHNDSELDEMLKEGIVFSTIHSYKGLENNVIIVIDFDRLDTIQNQRLLYIAISRAKNKLIMICDSKLQAVYSQLINTNIHLI